MAYLLDLPHHDLEGRPHKPVCPIAELVVGAAGADPGSRIGLLLRHRGRTGINKVVGCSESCPQLTRRVCRRSNGSACLVLGGQRFWDGGRSLALSCDIRSPILSSADRGVEEVQFVLDGDLI